MMKRIEVVAAIIRKGDKVFATQRGYGEWKDWWESFHLTMHCFICALQKEALHLNEHESARWLAADELASVRWLPADLILLPLIGRELGLPAEDSDGVGDAPLS